MRADFSITRLVAVLAVAVPCALGGVASAADGYTVVELGALQKRWKQCWTAHGQQRGPSRG